MSLSSFHKNLSYIPAIRRGLCSFWFQYSGMLKHIQYSGLPVELNYANDVVGIIMGLEGLRSRVSFERGIAACF